MKSRPDTTWRSGAPTYDALVLCRRSRGLLCQRRSCLFCGCPAVPPTDQAVKFCPLFNVYTHTHRDETPLTDTCYGRWTGFPLQQTVPTGQQAPPQGKPCSSWSHLPSIFLAPLSPYSILCPQFLPGRKISKYPSHLTKGGHSPFCSLVRANIQTALTRWGILHLPSDTSWGTQRTTGGCHS